MDFKTIKRSNIFLGVIGLIAGIFLLFWPMKSLTFICKIFGAGLLLYGIPTILLFFFNKNKTGSSALFFVIGILAALFGIWILITPESLITLIPTIIGIAIIIDSAFNIAAAMHISRQEGGRWKLSLTFAILTILLGLILILKPLGVANVITMLIGIFLIINGITDIVTGSQIKITTIPGDGDQ